MRFITIVQGCILAPAALFLLYQEGCTTIALLLGVGIAAMMTSLYVVLTATLRPLAVKLLSQIEGRKRQPTAYLLAAPVYLGMLFIPIVLLGSANPFLPADTSLTIAWLIGLGLTVVFVNMLHPEKVSDS